MSSGIHDCGADAAAYVLGALDADEFEAFRRHLESCSVCQAEVESLQELTETLPMAADQYPASRQLRRRVMAEVRADPRAQRRRQPAAARRDPLGRGSYGRGRERRYRLRPVGVGAALALAAAAVVAVVLATSSSGPAPGTRTFQASVGTAQVHVDAAGRGELIVQHLSPLPSDRIYEVWLQRATGAPKPANALFNVSARGAGRVRVPGTLHGVREVLVTQERAGGSPVPTSKPVVVTRIS